MNELKKLRPKEVLFWLLLPLNAFFGGHFSNIYDTNLVAFAILGVICAAGIWLVLESSSHPFLAVYSLFFSMMVLNTAATTYISGYADAHFEYYYAAETLSNGWDLGQPDPKATLISLNLSIPIFQRVLGVSLTSVFQFVVPMVAAFVGPGMLLIYRDVFSMDIGVKASVVIAFASRALIQGVGAGIARQMFSIVFFVLLLWILFNRERIRSENSAILIVTFSLVMVASYYATGFLFSAFLFGAAVLATVIREVLDRLNTDWNQVDTSSQSDIPLVLAVVPAVMLLNYFWYTNKLFYNIIGLRIVDLITQFLSISQSRTTEIATSGARALPYFVLKMLYIVEVGLIGLGFLLVLVPRLYDNKIHRGYYSLSGVMIAFLGVTTVLPYFYFDIKRIFTLVMLVLAPFLVLCLVILFDKIPLAGAIPVSGKSILSVLVVTALLLNFGAVPELMGTYPSSPVLSQNSIQDESPDEQVAFYNHYQNFEEDVHRARFMRQYTDYTNRGVYIDTISSMTLISYGQGGHSGFFVRGGTPLPVNEFEDGRYITLGYVNNNLNIYAKLGYGEPVIYQRTRISSQLKSSDHIYTTGNSTVHQAN